MAYKFSTFYAASKGPEPICNVEPNRVLVGKKIAETVIPLPCGKCGLKYVAYVGEVAKQTEIN